MNQEDTVFFNALQAIALLDTCLVIIFFGVAWILTLIYQGMKQPNGTSAHA